MTQEDIKLSPDALGYKDRGKMKWIGLMLSDHSEALKNQKQTSYSSFCSPKPKQPLEEISAGLYHSYSREKPLAIQLNIITEGHYLPDIEGFIVGFREDSIYLKQRDCTLKTIAIEDIRHIEWIDTANWFAKVIRQNVTI